jgi:hypothetical protein
MRSACFAHSYDLCGSGLPLSGPRTAIESAYTYVRVATASSVQATLLQGLPLIVTPA